MKYLRQYFQEQEDRKGRFFYMQSQSLIEINVFAVERPGTFAIIWSRVGLVPRMAREEITLADCPAPSP